MYMYPVCAIQGLAIALYKSLYSVLMLPGFREGGRGKDASLTLQLPPQSFQPPLHNSMETTPIIHLVMPTFRSKD